MVEPKEFLTEKSSNLNLVRYNEGTKTLSVVFRNGGEYEYENVPEKIYEELIHAESAGKYFIANVRNAFPCKKVSGPPKIHK